MKCAIFLLCVCAFKTVFAVVPFVVDLNGLHHRYDIKLKAVMASFNIFLTNEIEKALSINTEVSQCRAEYQKMERYHQARTDQCSECYRNALTVHKDIEVAEECYNASFLALQKKGISRRNAVQKCIEDILAGRPYNPRPGVGPRARPSTSN